MEIKDHEDLNLMRQGLLHVHNHHAAGAEIEQDVLNSFPTKKRSHSTLAFHVHKKARAKSLITQIDIEIKTSKPKEKLKIASTIKTTGEKIIHSGA
jgi:hypothetical protein